METQLTERIANRTARVAIIGLGYVGLPLAVAFAKAGFIAVGIEINLGDVLRVTFNIGDHTVVATGKVVWATDTDPITQEVGIEFHEIDPEAVRMLEETLEPEMTPVGLY